MSAVWHDIAYFINEYEFPQIFTETDTKPSFSPTLDDIHTDLLDGFAAYQSDATGDTIQSATIASCPRGNNGAQMSVDLFSDWSPASFPAEEIEKVIREIAPPTKFHENEYSSTSPEMQGIIQKLLSLPAGLHTESPSELCQDMCSQSAQNETQTIQEYIESVTLNDEASDMRHQQGMETQPQTPATYVYPIQIEYVCKSTGQLQANTACAAQEGSQKNQKADSLHQPV